MVSGPAITNLCLHTRKWAHERLRDGSFGPVIEHHGVLFARLASVQAYAGQRFNAAQIALATAGKPNRLLAAAPMEDED